LPFTIHKTIISDAGDREERVLYLVEVDDRLPEVISLLMEISHSNLAVVSRMVLVHVRSVVVLASRQTSTTGMLAMLAYTTVSGRDMTATMKSC
jgi:hypothetical protein